ncbi:MAG TPA: ATP-binding cassette domain-containing protein [Bryobacteraceae bacterium]|jgi:ATP-binding cassette subfamily B protein|nr:ATP-binding cassette domain-containing protein [Bryobacteraceae bacterium]
MTNTTFAIGLKPRSVLPGRQRWEIEGLRDNAPLAASIERWLKQEEGIVKTVANPVTGRVLVLHSPEFSSESVTALIQASVELSMGTPLPPGEKARVTPPSIPGMVLAGTGVVGMVGLWAGWTIALPAAVAMGAAAATTFAIRRWLSGPARTADKTFAPDVTRGRHPALILLDYMGAQKKALYRAAAFSVAARLLDMAPPLIIGFGVTILIEGGSTWLGGFGFTTVMGQVGAITFAGCVLWLAQAIFEFLASLTWRNLAQNLQHRLRVETYAHLQKLDVEMLQQERTGELASVLSDDINRLQLFLDHGASQLLVLATTVAVVCPLFFLAAPRVAWAAIAPIPVIAWLTFYHQERAQSWYSVVLDKAGALNSQLIDNLEGLTTIKSYNAEAFEEARIGRLSWDFKQSNRMPNLLAASYTPLVRVALVFSFIGVTALGGYQVVSGRMSAGVFASLNSITQRILWPFTEFGEVVDKYQRAMAAFTRILALLNKPAPVTSGTERIEASQVAGEIRMEHVSFAYSDRARVLNRVSLEIPAGRTAAIVGQTGIGKSTLMKLLLRFHEPESGSILLDGRNIRDLRVEDLRAAVGFVSQDAFMFDGTVMENITYGSPSISTQEIFEAARVAEAHQFVSALPQGYETRIGERGVRLSGGQRQRICLARAILKDSAVLVLDEATAFLDSRTEAAIQRSLRKRYTGRTVIVVTHRLARIANSDVIFVVGEGGAIVERGTHADLMALKGVYFAMWEAQNSDDLER